MSGFTVRLMKVPRWGTERSVPSLKLPANYFVEYLPSLCPFPTCIHVTRLSSVSFIPKLSLSSHELETEMSYPQDQHQRMKMLQCSRILTGRGSSPARGPRPLAAPVHSPACSHRGVCGGLRLARSPCPELRGAESQACGGFPSTPAFTEAL